MNNFLEYFVDFNLIRKDERKSSWPGPEIQIYPFSELIFISGGSGSVAISIRKFLGTLQTHWRRTRRTHRRKLKGEKWKSAPRKARLASTIICKFNFGLLFNADCYTSRVYSEGILRVLYGSPTIKHSNFQSQSAHNLGVTRSYKCW